MASKNANESIKRTGELLLSGWKLLNTPCPVCNTSLLSKGENLRCPMCDLPVVTEANQANMSKMENLPAPPASAAAAVAAQQFEIEDDYYQYAAGEKSVSSTFKSLDGAKKEYDRQNKYMDLASNKLGEKMLSGYSMLSTICPLESCRGTPLVRLAGKPMECVSCGTEYITSSIGDLVPVNNNNNPSSSTLTAPVPASIASVPATPASVPQNTSKLAAASVPPASDPSFFLDMNNAPILDVNSFASSSNDASAQISRYLMKGWAMLEKCCSSPQCKGEVPMMRDPAGQECCVVCGTGVIGQLPPPAQKKSVSYMGVTSTSTRATRNNDSASESSAGSAGERQSSSKSARPSHAHSEDSDSYSDSEAEAELWQNYRASRLQQEQKQEQEQEGGDRDRDAESRGYLPDESRKYVTVSKHQRNHYVSGGAAQKRKATAVAASASATAGGCLASSTQVALEVLQQKLNVAVQELSTCSSSAKAAQLADLIAKIGIAITAMQSIH